MKKKIVVTWKIMGASKASVIYIYIDNNNKISSHHYYHHHHQPLSAQTIEF